MILVEHNVQQHCGNTSKHKAEYRARNYLIRRLILMALLWISEES